MKWITRAHVHVDRVACPWLITRFIDSDAEFLFVSTGQIQDIAAREKAVSFDSPGAVLGHRNDKCTFETLIETYGITDRALQRMAKIIHAADLDELDQDPLAAGLAAIAAGFSLRYPDDCENLDHQFDVYDALYAWCRLMTARDAG